MTDQSAEPEKEYGVHSLETFEAQGSAFLKQNLSLKPELEQGQKPGVVVDQQYLFIHQCLL